LNGELTSRSKCKPPASSTQSLQSCTHKTINFNPADHLSTESQIKNSQATGKLLSESELIEQNISLFSENYNQEETLQQTIVFLQEPLAEFLQTGSYETQVLSPLQYHVDQVELLPDDLHWIAASLPAHEIRQGELNTPSIGKCDGNADGFTSSSIHFP
jgi:hypothetical protein